MKPPVYLGVEVMETTRLKKSNSTNLILKIYLFKFNENFFHVSYSNFKKIVHLGYTSLTVSNYKKERDLFISNHLFLASFLDDRVLVFPFFSFVTSKT